MLLSENLLKISILKNLDSRFGFRIEEPDIHSRQGNIRVKLRSFRQDHPQVKNEGGGVRWHSTLNPSSQAEAPIKAFTNNPFLASILDYNLLNKQGFSDQDSKFGFKIKALNSLPRGRENS